MILDSRTAVTERIIVISFARRLTSNGHVGVLALFRGIKNMITPRARRIRKKPSKPMFPKTGRNVVS